MDTVIIVGESRADRLLEKFGMLKAQEAEIIDCADAVVILGRGAKVKIRAALGVIIDGDDPPELPRAVQLISCGVSPKNTVSITSRTPEILTFSLNRSVRGKNGVCEPFELPAPAASDFSEYDQMAAFAARLLLK